MYVGRKRVAPVRVLFKQAPKIEALLRPLNQSIKTLKQPISGSKLRH